MLHIAIFCPPPFSSFYSRFFTHFSIDCPEIIFPIFSTVTNFEGNLIFKRRWPIHIWFLSRWCGGVGKRDVCSGFCHVIWPRFIISRTAADIYIRSNKIGQRKFIILPFGCSLSFDEPFLQLFYLFSDKKKLADTTNDILVNPVFYIALCSHKTKKSCIKRLCFKVN